jgi:hypothetical protein
MPPGPLPPPPSRVPSGSGVYFSLPPSHIHFLTCTRRARRQVWHEEGPDEERPPSDRCPRLLCRLPLRLPAFIQSVDSLSPCSHKFIHSSVRFLGMSENRREQLMDFEELSARANQGQPVYGETAQSEWIQRAAHNSSVFSVFKFCPSVRLYLLARCCSSSLILALFPMFNLVNHPHHGVDPAKYGVKPEQAK